MRALVCLIAPVLLLFASPAAAKIVTMTFGGTVLSGTDGGGLFGTAGGDLTGDAFTVVYTFDDSLGVSIPGFLQGGSAASPQSTSPAVSVDLAIDGQHFVTTQLGNFGRLAAFVTEDSSGNILSSDAEALAQGPTGGAPNFASIANTISGLSTVTENGPQYSGFSSGAGCVLPQNQCGAFFLNNNATHGQFRTTSWVDSEAVPIFLGSAVPEPATWGLMIVAMAWIGASGRARSQARLSKAV